MTLRDVEARDFPVLWAWRNAIHDRRPLADHMTWCLTRLAARETVGPWRMAVDASGALVGVLREDYRSPGATEVSIQVNPGRRGKGWGTRILATLPTDRDLWARIAPDNVSSRRIFEHAGFSVVEGMDESHGHVWYARLSGRLDPVETS